MCEENIQCFKVYASPVCLRFQGVSKALKADVSKWLTLAQRFIDTSDEFIRVLNLELLFVLVVFVKQS